MIVIGLCGGSGSGKTLVCRTILSLGIPVFESDAVYHRVIASSTDGAREIVNAFGEQVMDTRSGGLIVVRLVESFFPILPMQKSDFNA